LEPFSVKHASVISGVSRAYFQPVIDRNFKNKPVYSVGMPYGFDPNDHTIALEDVQLPWHSIPNCIPFVYAGVFYQGAHLFTKTLFQSIANLKKKGNWNPNFHFFFLGTGNYVEKSILAYASEYGIDDCIHEVRNRLPYLDILTILSKSAGIMILGSIEKYYTASKTFQAILSKKPVYAVLHAESTAVTLMQAVGAATYLTTYLENIPLNVFQSNIQSDFEAFILGQRNWSPNFNALNNYSAKVSTQLLVEQINLAIQK